MKIVLAYSGGLDTSVLLSWIKETYQAEDDRLLRRHRPGEELKGLEEEGPQDRREQDLHRRPAGGIRPDFIFPMMRPGPSTRASTSSAPASRGRSSPSAWWRSPRPKRRDRHRPRRDRQGQRPGPLRADRRRARARAPGHRPVARRAPSATHFPGRQEMIAYCAEAQDPVQASAKKECGDASPLFWLGSRPDVSERCSHHPPRAVATAPAGKRPRAAALHNTRPSKKPWCAGQSSKSL
jgi:argininosuccinate synthase